MPGLQKAMPPNSMTVQQSGSFAYFADMVAVTLLILEEHP